MNKITTDHLARRAFVYVRQSSPRQVNHNLENRTGDRADGEEDGCALRPSLGEKEICRIASRSPTPFGDGHHERQGYPNYRKDDVEGE